MEGKTLDDDLLHKVLHEAFQVHILQEGLINLANGEILVETQPADVDHIKDLVRGEICDEYHLMGVRLLTENPQAEVLQEDLIKEVIHKCCSLT